jgi:hypothetical protein
VIAPTTVHHLVVTVDPEDPDNPDAYNCEVECPGVTSECEGWLECAVKTCAHDALNDAEEQGDGEPVQHDETHRNIAGFWMTRTGRCYLVGHDGIAGGIADKFEPGRHSISWDVGDGTEIEIFAMAEVTG